MKKNSKWSYEKEMNVLSFILKGCYLHLNMTKPGHIIYESEVQDDYLGTLKNEDFHSGVFRWRNDARFRLMGHHYTRVFWRTCFQVAKKSEGFKPHVRNLKCLFVHEKIFYSGFGMPFRNFHLTFQLAIKRRGRLKCHKQERKQKQFN